MEHKGQLEIFQDSLKVLYDNMEKYIKSFLNVPKDNIDFDIQAIVQEESNEQFLLFCERVLGIAGNCKEKERFIEGILKLDLQTQTILMEIMVKYL